MPLLRGIKRQDVNAGTFWTAETGRRHTYVMYASPADEFFPVNRLLDPDVQLGITKHNVEMDVVRDEAQVLMMALRLRT